MQPAISLDFLSHLSSASARSGSDLKGILNRLSLALHTADGQPEPLPISLLVSLIEQLEASAQQGRFIFAYADGFHFDARPAISVFLTSALNLRQLLPLVEWVPKLVHPEVAFSVHDRGPLVGLMPQVNADSPRLRDHALMVELMAAIVVHINDQVAPDVPVLKYIHFKHEPHAALSTYEAYFRCPVYFAQPDNMLWGDARALDQSLPGSLPAAHNSAELTIRERLLGDGIAPPLSMQIERLWQQRPQLLADGLAAMARALHRHPRAIQRALQHEGLRYADLLARCRHARALVMLRDISLDIESIALKLGFNDRRSFTAAFRRWQGCAPQAYRASLKS